MAAKVTIPAKALQRVRQAAKEIAEGGLDATYYNIR